MRRTFLLLAAGVVAVVVGPQAAGEPRLLVTLVVDQLRADYLQLFDRHWRAGFRTLLDEGFVFDNARYPFLNTVTCAGHATIGTGAQPRTHGMVLNAWWDRETRQNVACTADGGAPAISYGRPVRQGDSARRLNVPTLADELRAQRPGGRVVALSLKPRSAIGLAGHGGDVVVWFDAQAGSFSTSRAYAAAPVPAVQDFIDRHPYEQDLGRVWKLYGDPASYRFRDAGIGERPPAPWSGLFPHVLTGRGGVDAQFVNVWQMSPMADAYLGRMAAALVDDLALGQRSATDFLGVGFSALDLIGHAFGPESREAEDALRHLDQTLGGLIERLDARVGRENYVLALTADHGVAPIAQAGRGGRIAPEDVRDRIEETLIAELGPLEKGNYVDAVSFVYVYFAPGIFERLRTTPKAMAAVERAVREMPGVSHVLRSDQLSDTSADPVVRGATLSHFPGRSGDLIVVPKTNWYFNPRNASAATTHGTLSEYDTHVPLVIFGGKIKPGRSSAAATPADLAPTLAHLAGIRLPRADGRILEEALQER